MAGLFHAPVMQNLMEQFSKLPGIGPKTAQRLAFFVLSLPKEQVKGFAEAMINAKETMTFCPVCFSLTDTTPCAICQDESRNRRLICVVEETTDVFSIERTRDYRGLYHVLQGAISPMEGKQPDDLRIKELLLRLESGQVEEIIMATNPDVEGETTALYLARLLAPFDLKITRIAHGIPVGSNLEHTDAATLAQALQGRRVIGGSEA